MNKLHQVLARRPANPTPRRAPQIPQQIPQILHKGWQRLLQDGEITPIDIARNRKNLARLPQLNESLAGAKIFRLGVSGSLSTT